MHAWRRRRGMAALRALHSKQNVRPIGTRSLLVPAASMLRTWEQLYPSTKQPSLVAMQQKDTRSLDMDVLMMEVADILRDVLTRRHSKGGKGDLTFFPAETMCHGPQAPARDLLERMLIKVGSKSYEANRPSASNDRCGFAIHAPDGHGKSTLLRLVTCLSAQMWNNAWPLYIDMRLLKTRGIHLKDLLSFLCEQRGHPCGGDDPLTTMKRARAVPMLLLDDLEAVYQTRGDLWGELAGFVSTPGVIVFAASTTSRLPLIVSSHDAGRLKEIYGIAPRGSLNPTKLSVCSLPPVTTTEHYSQLFAVHIPSAWEAASPANKAMFIREVAQRTGGNMTHIGKITNIVKEGHGLRGAVQIACVPLPAWKSIDVGQRSLLQALAYSKPQHTWGPALTVFKALAILKGVQHKLQLAPGQSLEGILDRYVHDGLMQEVWFQGGARFITARFPALIAMQFTVAVSQGCDDMREHHTCIAEDLRAVGLSVRDGTCTPQIEVILVSDTVVERLCEAPPVNDDRNCMSIQELDMCLRRMGERDEPDAFRVVLVNVMHTRVSQECLNAARERLRARGNRLGAGRMWDTAVATPWCRTHGVATACLAMVAEITDSD